MQWLYQSNLIFLSIILTPIIGGVSAYLLKGHNNLRHSIINIALFFNLIQLALTFFFYNAEGKIFFSLHELFFGLRISFLIDNFSFCFAFLVSFLAFITSLYCIGYLNMNYNSYHGKFYLWFCLSVSCSLLIGFSHNLLTTFIFYEALSFVTFPLIIFKNNEGVLQNAIVYLKYLVGTSVSLLLPFIIYFYSTYGNLTFLKGGIMSNITDANTLIILLFAAFYGIAKTGMVPFHKWLPAAMVAPTPVSALLHAVAVVNSGLIVLIKVVLFTLGPDKIFNILSSLNNWWIINLFPILASISILFASFLALFETNLKKRLAYSTISQLSYAVLAVSLFSKDGIIAALVQMFAHAVAKINLFFCAGTLYSCYGISKTYELRGLRKYSLFLPFIFTISSFSMIGFPPLAGFIAKLSIIQAGLVKTNMVAFSCILIVTLLNAAYFLPMIYDMFFKKPKIGNVIHSEIPISMWISMVLCTMLTMLFPIYYKPIINFMTGSL